MEVTEDTLQQVKLVVVALAIGKRALYSTLFECCLSRILLVTFRSLLLTAQQSVKRNHISNHPHKTD